MRFFAKLISVLMVSAAIILPSDLLLQAARVTPFSFSLSTHSKSTLANHALQFVVPAGVDESTDTFYLTYAAGFNLSNITLPQDIDLEIDNDSACDGPYADATLAASASAGVWGVSRLGQVITFTPPTDAGIGTITAGNCALVRIGENAVIGALGAGKIQNPATAGSHAVYFDSSFGDDGAAAAAIVDGEGVGVTATVGRPGGNNPPNPPDVTAPLILNLRITNITETTARATWNTDDIASSTWMWGVTQFFEVGAGNDPLFLVSHATDLTNLRPGTRYGMRVTATDMAGNTATETVYFTTLDHTNPFLIDPIITDITETTARVLWETDEAATSVVKYGKTTLYELGFIENTDLIFSHEIPLIGLDPGTIYHVEVRSTDAFGNEAVSRDLVFRTLEDLVPINVPLTVTPGFLQNTLTWPLPSEADVVGVQVVFRTDRYPLSPLDGTFLASDLTDTYVHTGLIAGQRYYYTIFPFDSRGQFASGSIGSGVPYGPDEPVIPAEPPTVPPVDVGVSPVSPPLVPPNVPVLPPVDLNPSAPPAGGGSLSSELISVLVAGGKIRLTPTEGVYHLLGNRPYLISLETSFFNKEVQGVYITINGEKYLMSREIRAILSENSQLVLPITSEVYGYITNLMSPIAGEFYGDIVVQFNDGSTSHIRLNFLVEPDGRVWGEKPDSTTLLEKALSSIYVMVNGEWQKWDAEPFRQSNPYFTNISGNIGWYVPNGTYDVRVENPGYLDARTGSLKITNNLLHPSLILVYPPESIVEIWCKDVPVTDRLSQIGDSLVRGLGQAQGSVFIERYLPWFWMIIGALIALGFAILFGALGLSTVIIGSLLALLIPPWCKKKLRTVFLSTTLDPIPYVVLNLYQIEENERILVKTYTTDCNGQFRLWTQKEGVYEIVPHKDHTVFPDRYLMNTSEIEKYNNLYHGEHFYEDNDSAILMDIPLDPEVDRVLYNRQRRLITLVWILFGLAFLASLLAILLSPSWISFTFVTLSLIGCLYTAKVAHSIFFEGRFLIKPNKEVKAD